MEALITVFVVLHMVALVAILVGWGATRFSGATWGMPLLVWSARAQLLIGLVLVGLNEAAGESLNHTKIAVKLLVMIGVLASAEIARARAGRGEPKVTLADAAAGLTVLNALIATLW